MMLVSENERDGEMQSLSYSFSLVVHFPFLSFYQTYLRVHAPFFYMCPQVNCVAEPDLCRAQRVMAFPTIRFFKVGLKTILEK